jgi:hypothetical protein
MTWLQPGLFTDPRAVTDFEFCLGSSQPAWLARAGVPLMVSDPRLRGYKTLPRAVAPWVLDSGGFTELQKYGRWTVNPEDYAARILRYHREIGLLKWAAPQDWMCEPIVRSGGQAGRMTFAGTGLTTEQHQGLTVANLVQLRRLLPPEIHVLLVVQGYTVREYLRHLDMYAAAGIDPAAEPLVGLGSVCRRQATGEACEIITALRAAGINRVHGFGVKTLGLERYGHLLASSDSLSWSDAARRLGHPMPGCPGHIPGCPPRCRAHHKNCANCLRYALYYRSAKVLPAAARAHLRMAA